MPHSLLKRSASKILWRCEGVSTGPPVQLFGDIMCNLSIDPPRGEEYWIPTDPRFQHAADLVSYIRATPEFSDTFSIGVAGRRLIANA